jgi:hypothetical protein
MCKTQFGQISQLPTIGDMQGKLVVNMSLNSYQQPNLLFFRRLNFMHDFLLKSPAAF